MPGYQVKFESVLIGDTRYPIRSLLDGNQYHDPDGAAGRILFDDDDTRSK